MARFVTGVARHFDIIGWFLPPLTTSSISLFSRFLQSPKRRKRIAPFVRTRRQAYLTYTIKRVNDAPFSQKPKKKKALLTCLQYLVETNWSESDNENSTSEETDGAIMRIVSSDILKERKISRAVKKFREALTELELPRDCGDWGCVLEYFKHQEE